MSNGAMTETPQVCDCGGEVRWESILAPYRERWLGVCSCGRMKAFLPDTPDVVPADSLTAYLVGPDVKALPMERPPWVRVMLISGGPPFNVSWTPLPEPCPSCDTRTLCGGRHAVNPVRGARPERDGLR